MQICKVVKKYNIFHIFLPLRIFLHSIQTINLIMEYIFYIITDLKHGKKSASSTQHWKEWKSASEFLHIFHSHCSILVRLSYYLSHFSVCGTKDVTDVTLRCCPWCVRAQPEHELHKCAGVWHSAGAASKTIGEGSCAPFSAEWVILKASIGAFVHGRRDRTETDRISASVSVCRLLCSLGRADGFEWRHNPPAKEAPEQPEFF